MIDQAWLPWLSAAGGVLSGLLIWVFTTGRWTSKREAELARLERDLQELQRAVQSEALSMRAFIERVNTDVGRLDTRIALLERELIVRQQYDQQEAAARDSRIRRLEEHLEDLRRGKRS